MSVPGATTFSIIVPTYNRAAWLSRCLGAVAALDYPRDRFEVIVVDDGGRGALDPVVAPYRDRLRLRLHRQENVGPASARNTGAALASGDHLAFTDDDCTPAPGWLDRFAVATTATPKALIGGRTVNALRSNPYAGASQTLVDYITHYYTAPRRSAFFASNNLAVPAALFAEVGGFDTTFPLAAGEDREFCDRWQARGLPIRYAADANVEHHHDLGLRAFLRQHVNYGRGSYQFHRAQAAREGQRIQLEGPRFYLDLVRFPFGRQTPTMAAAQSALLVVAQAANAAGFAAERRRAG